MALRISRREFAKRVAASVTAVGMFGLYRGSEGDAFDPQSYFVDLQKQYDTPEKATAAFVRAKTPLLMASYAVFFPELLRTFGRSAVNGIRLAADQERLRYGQDHHRLDSLPAVTAAHLLRVTKDDEARDRLCNEIARALADPRREVREIVLQNLITSVAPNVDAIRFFSVDAQVLRSIEVILSQAEDSPKLLTPAALAADFLLNSVALLRSRNSDARTLSPYMRLLDQIRMSKAVHFLYVSRLVDLHQSAFQATPYDEASLPPQSSEALMGWRKLHDVLSRDYLQQQALIRARLLWLNHQTAVGKLQSDNVMNASEARRALPKTIAFFRNFQLGDLLTPDVYGIIPEGDKAFKTFLRRDLRRLVAHPEREGVDIVDVDASLAEKRLKELVPFSQYDDYGRVAALGRAREDVSRRNVVKNVGAGLGSILSGYGAYKGYDEFASFVQNILGSCAASSVRPTEEQREEYQAALEEKAKQVDQGIYTGVDEQEAELGPVPIAEDENGDDA